MLGFGHFQWSLDRCHGFFRLILALACLAACKPEPPASHPPRRRTSAADSAPAQRIEADVRYLADDKLEGRDTGTPGYDLAAEYVARRYTEMGLKPAGDDGSFFQRVPLLKALRQEQGAQLRHRARRRQDLARIPRRIPARPQLQRAHPCADRSRRFSSARPFMRRTSARTISPGSMCAARSRCCSRARRRVSTTIVAPSIPPAPRNCAALAERGAVGVVFVGTPQYEERGPWAARPRNGTCPACACAPPMAPASIRFRNSRPPPRSARLRPGRLFAGSAQTAEALFKANRGRHN